MRVTCGTSQPGFLLFIYSTHKGSVHILFYNFFFFLIIIIFILICFLFFMVGCERDRFCTIVIRIASSDIIEEKKKGKHTYFTWFDNMLMFMETRY